MASPDNADIIKTFILNHHRNIPQNSHLPLMQANDRFIISAIMTGLINRVVWVKPDWDNPKNEATLSQGYVGMTIYGKSDLKRRSCICLQETTFKENKRKGTAHCRFFGEDFINNDNSTTIPENACRKMKSFRFIVLSESRFRLIYNTKKLRSGNIILDIDEDFFGVESGVQSFIDAGVPMDEIYMLDEILSNIYCPKSVSDEILLNDQLRDMFVDMSNMINNADVTEKLLALTPKFFCTDESVGENLEVFALYLKTLSRKSLKTLSSLKYCNTNSFRLLKTFQNGQKLDVSSSFALCHGAIFPDDTLNQIFVDTDAGINNRAHNLTSLLDYIFVKAKPGLFTIARSLRDGFTPRKQQQTIELVILNSIRQVLHKRHLSARIIYDKYLVFGKKGWDLKVHPEI